MAMPTIHDLAMCDDPREELERAARRLFGEESVGFDGPGNYAGSRCAEIAAEHGWQSVGAGPVGQSRDSDPLEESNYRVIFADLRERFGGAVADVRMGHWAVGWHEAIIFDSSRADVVSAVLEWSRALADYPVADESDYSELEFERDHPMPGECYSDYCRQNGRCAVSGRFVDVR